MENNENGWVENVREARKRRMSCYLSSYFYCRFLVEVMLRQEGSNGFAGSTDRLHLKSAVPASSSCPC